MLTAGLAAVAAAVLAGCTSEPPPPFPPPPSTAVDGIGEDGLTTATSIAIGTLVAEVRDRYGSADTVAGYKLPSGTTWNEVTSHYGNELGPSWQRDPDFDDALG